MKTEFKEKMKRLLGEEYPAFMESYHQPRTFGLRVNPTKPGAILPYALEGVPWCETGFFYDEMERPGKHPYHEMGLFYLQEPSAMAVTELLDPKPGESILDLCAAPGGKSTHIAGKMQNTGLLISNEIHPTRAKILSQNIERMGVSNCIVTNETPGNLPFEAFFDRILVDAPCSGEGMFRKDEDAQQQWSPDNVAFCANRQDEILRAAAPMLRPGGRLVYSTCTFSPEENEGTISRFLNTHSDFKLIRPMEVFSPGRPEWVDGNESLNKTYRLFPHLIQGEGHFIAVLQKDGKSKPQRPEAKKPIQGIDSYFHFAKETLRETPKGDFLLFGDQLYLLPEGAPDLLGLRVLRAGLHLGTRKKNRFEPSHALALFLSKEDAKSVLAVDQKQAMDYLTGQTLPAPGKKGWTLATLDGFPLGWGKASEGILKNHYPKGLRIQK